jgi:hypothetical protein
MIHPDDVDVESEEDELAVQGPRGSEPEVEIELPED